MINGSRASDRRKDRKRYGVATGDTVTIKGNRYKVAALVTKGPVLALSDDEFTLSHICYVKPGETGYSFAYPGEFTTEEP